MCSGMNEFVGVLLDAPGVKTIEKVYQKYRLCYLLQSS